MGVYHPCNTKNINCGANISANIPIIIQAIQDKPIYDRYHGWKAAEIYVESLIKSLEELINLKDRSGSLIAIEDKDVRRILIENFGDHLMSPFDSKKKIWKYVYDGWVSDFTKGMDNIGTYQEALDEINDRRMRYLPGNSFGLTPKDLLFKEYNRVYTLSYQKYLMGNIALSKYVTTQKDADYFNILYRSYTKIKLS